LKSTVIERVSFSLIQSAPLEKPAARFCFCCESVSLVGASPLRRSGCEGWIDLNSRKLSEFSEWSEPGGRDIDGQAGG